MKAYKATLKQKGMIVATAESSDKETVEREIQHYALMYLQDGAYLKDRKDLRKI